MLQIFVCSWECVYACVRMCGWKGRDWESVPYLIKLKWRTRGWRREEDRKRQQWLFFNFKEEYHYYQSLGLFQALCSALSLSVWVWCSSLVYDDKCQYFICWNIADFVFKVLVKLCKFCTSAYLNLKKCMLFFQNLRQMPVYIIIILFQDNGLH